MPGISLKIAWSMGIEVSWDRARDLRIGRGSDGNLGNNFSLFAIQTGWGFTVWSTVLFYMTETFYLKKLKIQT